MSEGSNNSEIPQAKRIPEKQFTRKHIKSKLSEAESQLRTDPLTGLLNRRGFEERLDQEISRARRTGDRIAVLYMDLNGLKTVNDNLGHDIGDVYIELAARALQSSFRPTDLVARFGEKADEYVVALPIQNLSQVKGSYAGLNERLEGLNEYLGDFTMRIPAGAVELDFNNVAESIRSAELLMGKAKAESKIRRQNVLLTEAKRKVA